MNKKATLSKTLSITVLPFMVLIVIPALLYIFVHRLFDPFEIDYPFILIPTITGAIMVISGFMLLLITIRLFHTFGRGTLAPWDPPGKLIIKGPYKYIRNPMIAGVFLILLGESFISISIVLFLWAIFFFIGNIIYFILSEEPGLEKRFGDDYRAYKKRVPMFIPWFKK